MSGVKDASRTPAASSPGRYRTGSSSVSRPACRHRLLSDESQRGSQWGSQQGSRHRSCLPTHPRTCWTVGAALCLLCAIIRSLITLPALQPNPPWGPYTKAAIGHTIVLLLSTSMVLIERGSVRLQSSSQFFLLVGALTFLGVAELVKTHAASFVPSRTLQALVAVWTFSGSLFFIRILQHSHISAGRMLALVLCSSGCLLVAQPDWFVSSHISSGHMNGTGHGHGHGLLNVTNHHPSNEPNNSLGYAYTNPGFSTNDSSRINTSSYASSLHGKSLPENAGFSTNVINSTTYHTGHAEYLIGCIICSVAGLFSGAWFTVASVMVDLPTSVIFFWTSMSCGVMSTALALYGEKLLLPTVPIDVVLLLVEACGAACVLYGTTIGARLTNPMVATALLSLSMAVNLPAAYIPPVEAGETAQPGTASLGTVAPSTTQYVSTLPSTTLPVTALPGAVHPDAWQTDTLWPRLVGAVLLLAGVIYTVTLETWRRHCGPQKGTSLHLPTRFNRLRESVSSRQTER